MKSLKQKCIDLFKNQEIKEDMKEIITPIFEMIYNEIYVYIWVISMQKGIGAMRKIILKYNG